MSTASARSASETADSPLYRHVVADARRALSLAEIGHITGVVAELSAREGMTVMAGSPLFRINGLSTVWVNAALGVAAGGGQFRLAIIAGAITLAVLLVMGPVEAAIEMKSGTTKRTP